jgi:hypothetical protein
MENPATGCLMAALDEEIVAFQSATSHARSGLGRFRSHTGSTQGAAV